MDPYTHSTATREKWGAGHCIVRHVHERAFAAIVLAGGYEECSNRGRFRVCAGDVLLHGAFDMHLDRFQHGGAQILDLTLPAPTVPFHVGRVVDPDGIARAAEHDSDAALAYMYEQLRPKAYAPEDWPEILAHDLRENPGQRLDSWSREHGLRRETVSRGFHKLFGVRPATFRTEVRARRALAMITGSELPLVDVAAASGFADQAHLSRSIRALTGLPPKAWRTSSPFKT